MKTSEFNITALTRARFPQPLAELCWLFSNLPKESDSEKLSRLKEIFEVLVKLSASVAVSSFLSEADRFTDDADWNQLRERVEGLTSPSLGHWVGTLRDVTGFFAKRNEDTPEAVGEIIEYFCAKFSGGRNSPEFESMATLAAFRGTDPGKPTIASAFNLLVVLRNKVGSGGHGANLNPVDTKRAVVALELLIASLLKNATFFERWTVVYVETVEKKKGQTVIYEAKIFDGVKVARERLTQQTAHYELCVDSECYFVRLDDSESIRSIEQAVSLNPYVVYNTCGSTKTDQLFFFNDKRPNGSLEYLCYVTGSHFTPLELDKDFENISKVMRGEMRASDVFRPLSETNERIPSPEERKQAEIIANEALGHIRGLDSETALRRAGESLKLDHNCALAHFVKGLGYSDRGLVSEAGESFASASVLSPNEPAYLLANSLVLALQDKVDQANAAVRSLQRCDPTNEFVGEYLSNSDDFAVRKFGQSASLDQKLKEVKKLALQQLDDANQEIVSWLYRLPPWKQIYLLSKRQGFSLPPIVSSLLGAILFFVVPVILHAPLILSAGFSSEVVALMSRHAIVALVCFCGFYYVFCINRFLSALYADLGKIVEMPRMAYRRWFMSEIGKAWGHANSNPETACNSALGKDRGLFLFYVVVVVACIPIHYLCSGDYSWNSVFPSEISDSLSNSNVSNVEVSEWTTRFQFVVRHFSYLLQLYLCVYAITFVLPFVGFFSKLLDLPIKYYPGIPESMTLKTLVTAFVKIAWLGLAFCVLILGQLFVFSCMSVTPLSAISYAVISLIVLPLYILIPSTGIRRVLKAQQERVVEEFSRNIEKSYSDAVSISDEKSFTSLKSKTEFVDSVRKMCPTFPLTSGALLSSASIVLILLASTAIYIYLTLQLDLPKF